MDQYLMRMGTNDLNIATGDKTIGGSELAKGLEQTMEYKVYFERFARRLGNDGRLLSAFVKAFASKTGVLVANDVKLRKVFEDPELLAQVESKIAAAGYDTELMSDEEHDFRRSRSQRRTIRRYFLIGIWQSMSNSKKWSN